MRIDEFSRQELRKSQATVYEFTSQIQELQDRVNIIYDSREFQDVESVCSGRLSHVPSQPAVVPSRRGMLSRDQSLRHDTLNLLGTSGNVFGNPPALIDSASTPYRGMFHSRKLNATDGGPCDQARRDLQLEVKNKNRDTIPTPRFARKLSPRNCLFPAEGVYPQNHVVDQQKVKISEHHTNKFPTPSTFSCWKIRFKTQVRACSSSPSEAMFWIKEVQMVDSVDDFKIIALTSRTFEMLDARIASALNKTIQNSYFKNTVSLEEQKAQKEDRFLRGRKIAYMIYDFFRVTGAHDTVLDYADLFTVTLRNDDIQEFDTTWDGILLSMTKIPPDILEGSYKCENT